VITLLFLSVITFLAIAFLSMTRRDRSAVTATLDVDTARSMSDAALARAQTEIIAQMMAQGDVLSYDYTASHNYITPAPLFNANETTYNANNVNYDVLGGSTNPNWARNIGNLFFDPRPPVFVMTNGNLAQPSNDFRFWVDINRNGQFESNGYVQMLDGTGTFFNPSVTNFYNGEPEWIGVLKYPEYAHSPTNPFIGRYAFMALPIGKTLDLNFIHNYSKGLNSPSLSLTNLATQDGFVRDEGVGSWELNLAALLNDINTNMYPPSGIASYFYNVNPNGWSFPPNTGYCFDDAVQFIRFRYASNYNNNYPFSLNYMLGTPPLSEVSNIDEYGIYPSTTYPFDYAGIPKIVPTSPWPGTYNSNMFYDIQDLFDPNKTGVNNANNGLTFAYRFATNMTNLDSYDRYTMQRLLDCIGTSSAPEYGVYVYSNLSTTNFVTLLSAVPPPTLLRTKVNINYDNTAQIQAGPYSQIPAGPYGPFTPMPTNLTNWTPLGFFTNAADLLLRSQLFAFTNYLTNSLGQYVTNNLGQYVQANAPSNWIYATFGITNIPVYVSTNPGVRYNEQIHRMLQLAANIYADANPSNTSTVNGLAPHPPVFRPQFSVTNNGLSNTFVYITNFIQVTNDGYTRISQPFYDLTNSSAFGKADGTFNLWGIPWVIGAVTNIPQFNQYSYQNWVYVARQLQFNRYVVAAGQYSTGRPQYTNQFYEMWISNMCGMDAWNPYSSPFYGSGNGLYVVASNVITITLTNNALSPYNWGTNISATNITGTSYSQPWTNVASLATPYWQASQFKIFLQTNFCALPLGYYSDSLNRYIYINSTNNPGQGFSTDTNQTKYPTHNWTTTVSNRVFYALFDGPPGQSSLLDFVNLGPFGSSFPITQTLINSNQFNLPPYPPMWTLANTSDGGLAQIPTAVQNQIAYAVNKLGNTEFNDSLLGISPGGYSASKPFFWLPGATGAFGTVAGNFLPYANYTDSNIWMACDPLVHYTLGDLVSASLSAPSSAITPLTTVQLQTNMGLSTGTVTQRYENGIQNGNPETGNMVFGDPNMTSPNNWRFPTNLFPGVGWLGRVHRGTPWQTIYLKSDNPALGAGWATNVPGNNTTPWVNSPFTYPTNDWSLIDLFTAVPNDNAARGLLSVNQTNDAAWAAVFAGVIALTYNTALPALGGIAINPTNDVTNLVDAINGINATRATNANGLFHRIGDILQASTLSVNSPFLADIPPADLTDEMVERIPQQTLSLMKLGLPQFVIYSWGQSLKPKNLYSSGSGNLLNICTNYEITGEFLTRTVCHIVSDPVAGAPRIVIDNYNIMPGN
jgi:hypothetical protein